MSKLENYLFPFFILTETKEIRQWKGIIRLPIFLHVHSVSDVFFTGALLSSQEEVYLVELGQRI